MTAMRRSPSATTPTSFGTFESGVVPVTSEELSVCAAGWLNSGRSQGRASAPSTTLRAGSTATDAGGGNRKTDGVVSSSALSRHALQMQKAAATLSAMEFAALTSL